MEAPSEKREAESSRDEEAPIDEESAPTSEEMAAYLGAPTDYDSDSNKSESQDRPLPSLADAEAMIPAKTKALMDELFRAKFERVKRIDPKQIR